MTTKAIKGARDWSHFGELRPKTFLILMCIIAFVVVLFVLLIALECLNRYTGLFAAGLFSVLLLFGAMSVVRQSRRAPAPLPGILLGIAALVGCWWWSSRGLDISNMFLDLIGYAEEAITRQPPISDSNIRSAFGGITGLIFFFGNVAFVFIYSIARNVLPFIIFLISKIPGGQKVTDGISRFPGNIWTNGFTARMTLTVVIGVWAALTLFAIWAAINGQLIALSLTGLGSNELAGMVWAGGYILLAEFAGAFRSVAVTFKASADPLPTAPVPDESRVVKLYDAIFSSDPDTVPDEFPGSKPRQTKSNGVDRRYSEPRRPASDTPANATDRVLNAVRRVLTTRRAQEDTISKTIDRLEPSIRRFYAPTPGQSSALVFEDVLSSASYDVFVEFILNEVDTGGAVLVLCPDGQELLVRDEIMRAFTEANKAFFIEMLVLGDRTPVDRQFHDLIIASETQFEHGLLDSTTQDRHQEIDRLSMILALDVHLMDLPRVRMMMRRLAERAPIADLRIVLSVTDIAHPEGLVSTVFLVDAPPQPGRSIRIGARGVDTIHRIALRDTDADRDKMHKVIRELAKSRNEDLTPLAVEDLERITDLMALVAIAAVLVELPVVIHDPRARRIGTNTQDASTTRPWSNETVTLIRRLFPEDPRAEAIIQLVAKCNLPLDEPSEFGRVVIVEETYSADAVMARPYDFLDEAPILVIAILRNVAEIGADALVEACAGKALLPLPPKPQVGPRDVAYVLGPYDPKRPLRETAVKRLIGEMAPKVRQGYSFAANVSGLGRLLKAANAGDVIFDEGELDSDTGEPTFVALKAPELMLTTSFNVSRSNGTDTMFMVKNDVGLLFADGGFTRISGAFEQITYVDANGMKLQYAVAQDCSFEHWRKPRLCHAYRLDFSKDGSFIVELETGYKEVSEKRLIASRSDKYQGKVWVRNVIASGLMTRRLICFYDELEQSTPLMADGLVAVARQEGLSSTDEPLSRRFLHMTWILNKRLAVGSQIVPPPPEAEVEVAAAQEKAVAGTALAAVVLLKEAIASCFPGQGHRVTVLSPQAMTAFGSDVTDEQRYLKERYGLTSQLIGLTQWGKFSDIPSTLASVDTSSRIDVIVIEDSEWSLGIMETLLDETSGVYAMMKRSCSNPPTFGADSPPDILNLTGLGAFLDILRSQWRDRESSK